MGSDDGDDHYHSLFSHDLTYDLNSKLMLTAIISLSAVIILVVALHLYARCVLRRRRSAFRGLAVLSRFSAQPSKRGLDPAVIASLPTFVVGSTNGLDDATSTETECAVCLSALQEQEMARVLPNCKHVFHVDCIDAWLESRSTCPICRAEADPRRRLEPEPREGPISSAPPSAPPLEEIRLGHSAEEASSSSGSKTGGSCSRLNSFRKILTRERSSNRIIPSRGGEEDGVEDLERR